jgi:hypothetical protein
LAHVPAVNAGAVWAIAMPVNASIATMIIIFFIGRRPPDV